MKNERRAFVLMIAILLVVFLSESYLFWYGNQHHWNMGRLHGDFLPSLGINPILIISFLLFIGLIYYLTPNKNKDAALEMLKIRYVRGEITRDEYVERFRDIMQGKI